ncbi:MAG: glycoside hydrolase family 99-like domain-containing protein [Bacteroidales bacterium]|nr:glycoside hydrolase family 99-like domain-containing protein [Bacteroidales bacterium]
MRRIFIKCALSFCAVLATAVALNAGKPVKQASCPKLPDDLEKLAGDAALLQKPEGLEVASYVFPNYCATALHNKMYSQGWTEYNLVRGARPWFEGHDQPRTPLLGELDESLPSTWEVYNKLCKQSGVDVLIWDWYWYDGKPCLHEALENGFLESSNRNDVKFACMWTNHDWYVLYPTKMTDGSVAYPPSFIAPDFSYEEAFRSLSYIVTRYFNQPNYWRIDGKPVICIWDAARLEQKLGLAGVQRLFGDLREFAVKLGYPGIHFHIVGFTSSHNVEAGYNTSGSYNPMNWIAGRDFPSNILFPDYGEVAAKVAFGVWDEEYNRHGTPFIPAVATGWDSTPRYINRGVKGAVPDRGQWPGCTILANENPAAFKAFMQASFWYLNCHPDVPRFVTIACFNEWSEGHYLLPDNRFGYGMLDALAEALGKDSQHTHHSANLE